jgi:hypothetical protein
MTMLAADKPGKAVRLYDDAAQQWRGAIDRIRETAKWIVVIFGAVGGLLAGTAPLSGASSLRWDGRGQIALAMAVVAFAGLGLTIGAASAVLLPRTVTLRALAEKPEFDKLRAEAERDPSLYLLPHAESIKGFFDSWYRDMRSLREFEPLRQRHERDAAATACIEAALWVVIQRVNATAPVAQFLLTMGMYDQVRRRFSRLRVAIFVGGALAAIGIAGYQVAAGTTAT